MGFFVAFLGMVVAAIVYAFKVITRQTKAAEEAEREAAAAKAKVEEAKAEVGNVEKATALIHAEVEKRLADLDRHIAEERARDSVDVANDIIGRN